MLEAKPTVALQNVPQTRNFVERRADTMHLENSLLLPESGCRLFILHGMAGIGKTQLAADFVRRHCGAFSYTLWFNAATESSLLKSIQSQAGRLFPRGLSSMTGLGVKKRMELISDELDRISSTSSRWLLVLDNLGQDSDSRLEIMRYMHESLPASKGSVLVTTQLRSLSHLGSIRPPGPSWTSSSTALDGLPVALAQTGRYLRGKKCDLATFVRRYVESNGKILTHCEHLVGPCPLGYPLDPRYPHQQDDTAWTLSMRATFRSIEKHDGATAKLLLLWSCLDSQMLRFDLLKPAIGAKGRCQWLHRLASDKDLFDKAVDLLDHYSLITRDESDYDTFSMHLVVHNVLASYRTEAQTAEFGRSALDIIARSIPQSTNRQFWIMQKRLLPHANRYLTWLTNNPTWSSAQDSSFSKAVALLGDLYNDQGMLAQAEWLYKRAFADNHGTRKDYVFTPRVMNSLATVYTSQGRFTEAEALYRQALRISKGTLGPRHALTLNITNDLANLCADKGRFDRVLDPSTLNTISNMASLQAAMGRDSEAENMFYYALQGQTAVLGPDHAFTLNTLNNIALIFAQRGMLTEATILTTTAIRGLERSLDSIHPLTLNFVHNKACLLAEQKLDDSAESLYQRALDGFMNVTGCCHTGVLSTIKSMQRPRRKERKNHPASHVASDRVQQPKTELSETRQRLDEQTSHSRQQGEQIQQLLNALGEKRPRRRSRSPDYEHRTLERVRERSPIYESKNKNQVQIQLFRGISAAELSTFVGTLEWVFREHPRHYRDEQRRIRLAAGHLSQTLRGDFLDNLQIKFDGSEENMTWEDMQDWLWSNINNPRGRSRNAYTALTKLKQKPRQSFRDFFREYRAIESEFPHIIPDWLRIEMFLFCCNKDIKDLFRS
ncbi:hypothetical protein HIM_11371 [Hirsutella minnesotensis 3608]|uniref:NB-ARC domain-containing protein n=1 Tax=Hirsutella minnesotensis 3608 TaxID=1043627 RepID=A0A0F7ZRA0_9HYPO|nr:hypothetical protein HIM_11371 [Hirsutella minnesotensis 3608]